MKIVFIISIMLLCGITSVAQPTSTLSAPNSVDSFMQLLHKPTMEELQVVDKKELNIKTTPIYTPSGYLVTMDMAMGALRTGDVKLLPYLHKPSNKYVLVVERQTEEDKKNQLESYSNKIAKSEHIGKVGKPIKEKDIYKNKINTKDSIGKIVVLNFWFINCPPCRAEIPELNKLVVKYKDSAVLFLGLALDDKADLKEFLKEFPFDYTIIANSKYWADTYYVKGFPTNVIVDTNGIIQLHTSGFGTMTAKAIDKKIEELLAQKNIK